MHQDSPKILIVEDEPSIADNIVFALQLDGFHSEHQLLATSALASLRSTTFDLVIIDVGLPDINGFELCKQIRDFSNIPIIFLTARADEIDRILGLELGADDYVTKPFSPRELSTRVKAILRRVSRQESRTDQPHSNNDTSQYGFTIDKEKASITYLSQKLELTRIEYFLLSKLIENPEHVFSREQLMQAAWDNPEHSLERAVDTHIKGLRAKLKQISNNYQPIKTHRGLGYSLELSE
jgi:two-component system catabolic regulation response regulator CreB